MFNLSSIQSKGHFQNLFQIRNFLVFLQSLQTSIDESKTLVSETDELEEQKISTLTELSPLLVNQDSSSDVEDNLHYT